MKTVGKRTGLQTTECTYEKQEGRLLECPLFFAGSRRHKKGQEISLLAFVKHLGYNTPTDETATAIVRLPVHEILPKTMTGFKKEGNAEMQKIMGILKKKNTKKETQKYFPIM